MTFPSAAKKSGPITISKTGSGSKTLSGSPRSPGSPLNTSTKLISSGSSVKPSASKAPEKTNFETSVKKISVPPKILVSKPVTEFKPEPAKIVACSTKGVTKSAIRPPPLKLNVKAINTNGLESPVTPKFITKFPTTVVKPEASIKSPTASKLVSTAQSSVSTGVKLPSSPIIKSSQTSTISSPVIKSPQVTTRTKSSTTSLLALKSISTSKSNFSSPVNKPPQVSTLSSKSTVVSSPVTKSLSLSAVSKTSSMTSTVPKSLQVSVKPSTSTVKSVGTKAIVKDDSPTSLKSESSKDKTTVVKPPTTPVKKATVLTVKSVPVVKLPITPTNKSSSMMSRSSSITSSPKSISVKAPTSPSKLLTTKPSTIKILPIKSTVTKSIVNSKAGPISPKVMVKKESSTLLVAPVKSSSTIKSTSVVSKTTTLKTKVLPSTISKNLAPKSPVTKTQSSSTISKNSAPKSPVTKTQSSVAVTKRAPPSSPTTKTPLSPIVKTKTSLLSIVKIPLSPSANAKIPLSPTLRTRTTKAPLSPQIKKLTPTKLVLSPGLTKSKSLSSSRLSSISTESLASRTSLKSPMSPKFTKVVPKSPSKIIKKTEQSNFPSIRGEQPCEKAINIPGITELPSNLVCNEKETENIECRLESIGQNVLNETIVSTITQISDQDLSSSEELETHRTVVSTNNSLERTDDCVSKDTSLNITKVQNVDQLPDVQEHNLETIEEDSIVYSSSINLVQEQENDKDICSSLGFVVVKMDECVPQLNNISQSTNNCDIAFNDNHFNLTNENIIAESLEKTQSCTIDIDIDDNFEPMNDKLVLGDVPFETDSSQSDTSDNEHTIEKETDKTKNFEAMQTNGVDDMFSFTEDLSINDSDSTENFIDQFLPKSIGGSEGESSISTDDGSIHSRKSYSEAVVGAFKDGEYYFNYDFEIVDDCLDCNYEDKSVFVEVTEKEFPELKPKDVSDNRRRNRKQKKRNSSNRAESQSDSNISFSQMDYNPDDFNGNEFCHYIKMMKDCSFYPNGFFSSDSVKLPTSSSLSWLDISVRTTDDDLAPSTELLSTYEIFQESNLNKDFLTSIIGSTVTSPTNETSWYWKSIEGRHQTHNKTNITLSLKPRPKHLATPRFMVLLALISEAKGYQITPSLSEHFVTDDCMPRFDDKIRRLMVQGLWLVGRLIKESLFEDEEVNCGNPFEFADGDIGFWWAGINMLDWQEYVKECCKIQSLQTCFQFVVENMDGNRRNSHEAELIMNAKPEDFMSELDIENFIHTVRSVKYYSGDYFVDSQNNLDEQNLEATVENGLDDGEWKINEKQN